MPRKKKTNDAANEATTTTKVKKPRKTKAAADGEAKTKVAAADGEAKTKKLSALDAAAKVLAESAEPLNTQQMIEAMSAKGYWSSPGGKTPAATLYSALIREIKTKGGESRFKKTDRGLFARNPS